MLCVDTEAGFWLLELEECATELKIIRLDVGEHSPLTTGGRTLLVIDL